MSRIWKSPFVRLAAYYAILGLATLLLIRTFPQLRDLFERFQELSPVHGAVSRKDALEAAGTPGPASPGPRRPAREPRPRAESGGDVLPGAQFRVRDTNHHPSPHRAGDDRRRGGAAGGPPGPE